MIFPEYSSLIPNHCREIYIKTNYPYFYSYLYENYTDELSFGEKLYWYYNGITEHPKCKNCGKKSKFINAIKGYNEYCCVKCSNSSKEKIDCIKKINNERYGGNAPACSKEVLHKMQNTNLERYCNKNYNNRESAKKTLVEKYGGIGNASETLKKKQRKTMLEKYGVENPMLIDSVKEKIRKTNINKYSVDWVTRNKNVINKINETKKNNHTFSTSKIEELFKEYLENNNVNYKRQYSSQLYPFRCDFYFPDYDLYLEIQGSWTHGFRPFDKNKKNKFYEHAINTWTIRDVEKRNIAKTNKLNYLEVFTNNIDELIDEYKRAIERFQN